MLKIKQFVFNPFGESTFVVSDEVTRQAIVVDPGMTTADEEARLDKYIDDNKLVLTGVVNTHMHLDHCFGIDHVRDRYGVPLRAHPADAPLGRDIAGQAAKFGMRVPVAGVEIDEPLHDGDRIMLGKEELEVIHVPGHSPGGIALYSATGKFVLAGDSLFAGAVGRTDILGGDHAQLIDSVRRRLLTLPGDTLVIPGHDRPTTIATERDTSPYLR